MGERARIAAAVARLRWGRRFATREALQRWQARRIDAFVRHVLPLAPFYRARAVDRLDQLPIVDKRTVLADFAAFNTRGVTLDRALDVATAAERTRDFAPMVDGLTVGLSSGTSGTRGVFLVSASEREQWAGLMLARLLKRASLAQLLQPWRAPLRVAFSLRANSNLYETVASQRLRFMFHDLLTPISRHVDRLNATGVDVLIAPPTVLRRLAEAACESQLTIAPRQVVSVAEVIEPDDRAVIGRAFGVPVQEVYQATEGCLAVSCAAGRLHLNEDVVHVEPEWLDDARQRFRPIITDFCRTTQLVVRYRLDDVLRVAEGPCACGQVTRRLEAVEGRADDVLWSTSTSASGAGSPLFPDTVRRAMALAGDGVRDYRLDQHDLEWRIALDVDAAHRDTAQVAVRRELDALCHALDVRPAMLTFVPWRETPPAEKRRRIRCTVRPGVAEAGR